MPQVLVVDDAMFMRFVIRRYFEQAGLGVIEATNGRQALECFAEARPDAVVLDITMPDMDGLDALRELRAMDPDVRVVMCSAMLVNEEVQQAVLASGAAACVPKPFQPRALLDAVLQALPAGAQA